jgi:hypothetical protein
VQREEAPSTSVTIAVTLGTVLLAFCALGLGRGWSSGVIGGGDAWQNLWNVGHVRRSICDGSPLFTTTRLWAPEGASLATHTLSLPFTIPPALVTQITGLPLAYNLAVLLSFAVAGAGVFRLARRLGVGNLGATVAALCFSFAPPRFARAYGHLNLLGLGFLGFALEGLILTGCPRARTRLLGAIESTVALTALVYTDLYLAALGALAAASFCVMALWRETPRARRALIFLAVAMAVTAFSGPLVLRVVRDAPLVEPGHPSKWCSVALTSLVIPSRVQVLSALTTSLTQRNHQNLVEGVGYLGWVPLFAVASLFLRGRPRQLDFLYVSGLVALVLSLGPQPRIFDRLLSVPLPYAWLESVFPSLKLGGCVNRFEQLALIPLALSVGFWVDRIRPRPLLTLIGLSVLCLEYMPWRVPVETWPLTPIDPALEALARDESDSVVFDVQGGAGALARQITHGHPLLSGYLSRNPLDAAARRRQDPVIRMLEEPSSEPFHSPAAIAADLQYSFRTRYVLTRNTPAWVQHLENAGLVRFAASPDRTFVAKTVLRSASTGPVESLTPADVLKHDNRDIVTFGLNCSPDRPVGTSISACAMDATAGFLLPAAPGTYDLVLLAPDLTIQPVDVSWGPNGSRLEALLYETHKYTLEVGSEDLIGATWLGVSLRMKPPRDYPEGRPTFFLGFRREPVRGPQVP